MVNRLFLSFLFIGLLGSVTAQEQKLPEKAEVRIGAGHEYPDLQSYFKEERANVTVIVEEGDYYNDEELWVLGKNITIIGEGKVVLNCTDEFQNVMWVSGDSIHLFNLTLKHHKPGTAMENCVGKVLAFDNATNCMVVKCDINGCGSVGVHDNLGNSNILLVENYIHYNSIAPIGDISGNTWMSEVRDHPTFIFANNRIENNGPGRVKEDGSIRFLNRSDFNTTQSHEYDSLYTNWFNTYWFEILTEFEVEMNCDKCPALSLNVEITIDDKGVPVSIDENQFFKLCQTFYEPDDATFFKERLMASLMEHLRFSSEFYNTRLMVRVGEALKC